MLSVADPDFRPLPGSTGPLLGQAPSTFLIELADNAMYKCDEEVVVPNELVRRMSDCSTRMTTAFNELLSKIS